STHPDLAADDSRVVYVLPTQFLLPNGSMSATTGDDTHFYGGSLFIAPFTGSALGTPSPLLMSTGENNYYPAFSPDGTFVIFDRVMGAAGAATDAFANPHAQIWAMSSAGGMPVQLATMNRGDG